MVGLRVGGRIYRAALAPDRKAGGYWVTVRECPGCITEGGTLAEAKRMARQAIELWLTVAWPEKRKVFRAKENASTSA